jgi:hypothetical protein
MDVMKHDDKRNGRPKTAVRLESALFSFLQLCESHHNGSDSINPYPANVEKIVS